MADFGFSNFFSTKKADKLRFVGACWLNLLTDSIVNSI